MNESRPFGAKTLGEVASDLGVHPGTLARYVRQGRLRAVKVGRRKLILPDEVRRFLTDGAKATGKAA